MQRFNVVVPLSDDGVTVHPMKKWLRDNPTHVPPGMSAFTSTSHQLRAGLKRQGWTVQETADEVLLVMPGSPADAATVHAILGESQNESDTDAAAGFAIEAQLRDFIAENLSRVPINGVVLRLFTDSSNRIGIEYPTGVGPIDILAVDSHGNLFVFELKLGRGPDRAIGQLAKYMGWVKTHLANDHTVGGVVVARSIDERLRYAAAVFPNIALLEYEVAFTVRPIQAHGPAAG